MPRDILLKLFNSLPGVVLKYGQSYNLLVSKELPTNETGQAAETVTA